MTSDGAINDACFLLGAARDAPRELHHYRLRGATASDDPIVLARQVAPEQVLVTLRRLLGGLVETSGIVASLRRHDGLSLEPKAI